MNVSALFVDPKGPYPKLLGLEACWSRERDARNYDGRDPVVAHPPCQLWTNLARVNYTRYGGQHNKPGYDGGCFAFALATLRRCGGVLEHPAGSHAFKFYGLLEPRWPRWGVIDSAPAGNVWSAEVWQSAYGHKARKRTWLLYVGDRSPLEARWERPVGTHQIGWFDRIKPTLGKREASETPIEFAEYLIALARHSRLYSFGQERSA